MPIRARATGGRTRSTPLGNWLRGSSASSAGHRRRRTSPQRDYVARDRIRHQLIGSETLDEIPRIPLRSGNSAAAFVKVFDLLRSVICRASGRHPGFTAFSPGQHRRIRVRRDRTIGKINTRSRSAQRSSLRSMRRKGPRNLLPVRSMRKTLRLMRSTPRFTASRRGFARSRFGLRRGRPAPAPG